MKPPSTFSAILKLYERMYRNWRIYLHIFMQYNSYVYLFDNLPALRSMILYYSHLQRYTWRIVLDISKEFSIKERAANLLTIYWTSLTLITNPQNENWVTWCTASSSRYPDSSSLSVPPPWHNNVETRDHLLDIIIT